MNLSESSLVDKELFSGEHRSYENTNNIYFILYKSINYYIITHSLHNIAKIYYGRGILLINDNYIYNNILESTGPILY
jgi:hypothetical protein